LNNGYSYLYTKFLGVFLQTMIFLENTYLECRIPEKNKEAFYQIIAGHDLFGLVLIRHWGRIGTKGQPKLKSRFESEDELMREYLRVLKTRFKHRYLPVERCLFG